MKRLRAHYAEYHGKATVVQHGPCLVVRDKGTRVLEHHTCPELVLGGDVDIADTAPTPFEALAQKYWGGHTL